MNKDTSYGEAGRLLPEAPGDRELALQLLNSNHPLEQFEIFVKATGLKWHGLFSRYDCDIEDADNRATMKAFGKFCAFWEEVFTREGARCLRSRSRPAARGSVKITRQHLESILINEGVIQAAAIEDPEGYDGGKTELAMTNATQQINELISPNESSQAAA